MGLMGASGSLLSKAALHPSIAALQVAIVGVRAFGVARPVLRYLERLSSHDVTLRLLARLRLSLFRALVPLAPARLMGHRGGDVLGRVLEDVGSLEGLYTRLIGPSLAAVAVAGLLVLLLAPHSLALAAAALGLVLAGLVAPRLAVHLGEAPGRRLLALRAARGRARGRRDGVSDLLVFGRAEAHAATLAALGSERPPSSAGWCAPRRRAARSRRSPQTSRASRCWRSPFRSSDPEGSTAWRSPAWRC